MAAWPSERGLRIGCQRLNSRFIAYRKALAWTTDSTSTPSAGPTSLTSSRTEKPENVRRHFKPSPEAISELTSLLAPGDARR
ncbi:hypothetical protein ACIRU3_46440 [Streptomyces sp. NPDC101151]|uniref:hypothetical protein n=1 Tax=Streptomyces sp. NPDC101151 TaxID=3366115 RepID=UPI0037F92FC3